MIFLAPSMLGLLGLSALITFLYFLRRRAQVHTVSALFLWRASTERPRSALSLLWSRVGLLLIQLLALSLIVLGLSRPILTSAALGGGKIAVIVDGSASMQARYGNQTRYSEAVAQAMVYIKNTRPAQLTLIQAQYQSRLVMPMSSLIDQALEKLSSIEPTLQGDANTRDLLEILRSQADLREYREIAIFSDRLVTDSVWRSLPVRFVALGKAMQNIAVTGFAVRMEPNRDLGQSIWAEIGNFSDVDATVELKFRVENTEIHTTILALKAHEKTSYSFAFKDAQGQQTRFTVSAKRIDGPDAFRYDDERYFSVPERATLRVLWVGDENIFLERALLSNVRLQIARLPRLLPTDDLSQADVIVANNVQLPEISQGHWLIINSSSDNFIEAKEFETVPSLRVTQNDHRLLYLVEPSHLRIARVRRLTLPIASKTLLAAGDHPALFILEKFEEDKELRVVGLAFSLQESNLVLTVDFPILVRNALSWLLPQLEPITSKQVGQPLGVPKNAYESIEVYSPRGNKIHLGKDEDWIRTDALGFYQMKSEEERKTWAVNLAPTESEPGTEGAFQPSAQSQQEQVQVQSQLPLWRFLLALALLALLGELFVYDRTFFKPTGDKAS
jgi:hypothetical protein